jgi:hypothetical protein
MHLLLSLVRKRSLKWFEISANQQKALDVSTFAWIYNAALFQKNLGAVIPLRDFAQKAENDQYSEDLEFAHAIQQF